MTHALERRFEEWCETQDSFFRYGWEMIATFFNSSGVPRTRPLSVTAIRASHCTPAGDVTPPAQHSASAVGDTTTPLRDAAAAAELACARSLSELRRGRAAAAAEAAAALPGSTLILPSGAAAAAAGEHRAPSTCWASLTHTAVL